ncbi:MAG: type VI secretion system tip protein TssI/VgrG [Alphaproteobacteria bacterium]
MTILSQENLSPKITTPLGDDFFVLDYFDGVEEVSNPFKFTLNVHSKESFDFKAILKKDVSVCLDSTEEKRYFSGIVGEIRQKTITYDEQAEGKLYHYEIILRPSFWLLKFTRDHRIFQNLSSMDIIHKLLSENGVTSVEDLASRTTCKRIFCVQYGESVFDFISRLMEEEGIFYYFKFSKGNHTLVLDDNSSGNSVKCSSTISFSSSTYSSLPLNTLSQFQSNEQIVVKCSDNVDFNYETPLSPLAAKTDGDGFGGRVYEFPGYFDEVGEGETLSSIRIQEHERPKCGSYGKSSVYTFSPGFCFELSDHPQEDFNKTYFIYKVIHRFKKQYLDEIKISKGAIMPLVYENEFNVIPKDIVFRPKRVIKKPRIYGTQTAIVTGPPGEEIHCDELGRIKVHFHWDQLQPKDDKSSCWIRVAQTWAGKSWGALVTPRIGMEVVVTFIEGNPDRPLIIGCVYNRDFSGLPYPAENPRISAFYTNSSLGGGGFNELHFDDTKDEENIYKHAQKDVTTDIEDSQTETIYEGNDFLTLNKGSRYITQDGDGTLHAHYIKDGDKTLEIKKGNRIHELKEGNHEAHLDKGDHGIFVKKGNVIIEIDSGNKNVTLKSGNYSIELKSGNMNVKVVGNISFECTGDMSLKAAKNIMINAGKNIITMAGQNIITTAGQNMITKANTLSMLKAQMIMTMSDMVSMNKAGLAILQKSDLAYVVQANLSTTIQGGLSAQIIGGLSVVAAGGLSGTLKGKATISV